MTDRDYDVGDFKGKFSLDLNVNDVNFLVYLGWKALGWALVFLAVVLIMRFFKLYLLHAWQHQTFSHVESSRADARVEISARLRRRRRRRIQRWQQQQEEGDDNEQEEESESEEPEERVGQIDR